MKKSKKILNDDELLSIRIRKCAPTSLGRLLYRIRLQSPLSHLDVNENTSINSGTAWRLENNANYSVASIIKSFFIHLSALNSEFYLHALCRKVEEAQDKGKSLVVLLVDEEQLAEYESNQIIFYQKTPTEEEFARRKRQKNARLMRNRKMMATKWKKKLNMEMEQKKNSKKR